MLALVVSAEVDFALEAFGADVASERFEARVLPAVGDQVGALAERFTAHLAFMRLLTRVNVRVFLHIRFLVEPFATVLAGVRPGVGVDEQVCGQGGGALERLPAHLTLEAPLL